MKPVSFPTAFVARLTLAFGLLLTALAIGNYFSFYPPQVRADEEELFGEPFLAASGNAIALIVDTATIRQAGQTGRFSQTDWSYGWMNLLLQEARSYDILDMSELSSARERRPPAIWIFTRSAIAGSSGAELNAILDSLPQANGGQDVVAYLEAPDTISARNAVIASLLGGAVEPRRFSRLTHLRQSEESNALTVPDFELSCDGLELKDANEKMRTLALFDSLPVLWEARRPGLRVLLATFNFGQLAVTIQQGRPNEDFSVTPGITKRTGLLPLVSSDLCADSSYYLTFSPFFDLFERALFELISGEPSDIPLFANSTKGAFIMSHDEEGMGDKASWMVKQERRWGVTSATLVTPAAISSLGLGEIAAAGGEVGLHTDQYSYFKRPGLPGLRPLRVERSIAEQKRSIEQRLPKSATPVEEIIINRNHWLLWSGNYTGMFRKLAGAGVKMDLSYGPIGKGVAGYLFGTCFPFVPLDTNGFPLPILELPFLFQDDEDYAAEYLDSIFDTTRYQNEIVNVIFHTNTMGNSPDTLLMWGWRESFLRAESAKLPILRYTDVLEALLAQKATAPPGILQRFKEE